ncbi:hypothetical protein ACFLRT_02505 [Acidobacteriota bacterium]
MEGKNYKLQITMPLSKKKAGAVSIPNYNVPNYKQEADDRDNLLSVIGESFEG